MAGEKITYNICPMAGCHEYCIIKVHTRNNQVVKVESADMPQDPQWRCICLKGLASLRLLYSPERLRYPLKRTGKRGEGKWQRISWDEALDFIASKMLEIKEKYGAQAIRIIPGGSSSVGAVQRTSGLRFANLWGSSTFEGKGYSSDGGNPASSLFVLGESKQGHSSWDSVNSKLVVLWSYNAAETKFRAMRGFVEAVAKGVKTVTVGPVFDSTASKGNSFIPVRAGTDAALALAMINVIVEKKLYDEEFIRKHTVGPFLINPRTGRFLRESDMKVKGDSGKYVVWDPGSNKPADSNSDIKSAILGKYAVADMLCSTSFQLLAERAAEYPLRRASEITGIPPEVIEKFAIEYAVSKPASIYLSDGLAYTKFGDLGSRAILILGAITGNIGVKGGGVTTSIRGFESPFNTKKTTMPSGAPGQVEIPGSQNSARGWTAIREGKPYPVKGLLIFNQNMLTSYGNANSYIDMIKDMDLVVVCEIQRTWTTDYADIVLPDSTVFEREDVTRSGPYIVYQAKAVDPLPEARCTFDIWKGLAQRVGLGKYFDMTIEDFTNILLDSKHPYLEGITLGRLKNEGMVRMKNPPDLSSSLLDKHFHTPTGKAEIYVEDLVSYMDALPSYKEKLEDPASSRLASKYPLTFLTKKRRQFTGTQGAHVDWLNEVEKEPSLQINPADALKRSISSDDRVRAFNDRGSVELKASVTESMQPGTVNIHHGWARDQFFSGHYNLLTRPVDDIESINPSLEHPKVVSDSAASGHLIYYDVLCEVEKVK